MNTLHGLRLNCWLAPLTAVALGLAALAWHHVIARQVAADATADGLRAVQELYARLEATGGRPPLATALAADARWSGLAEIRFARDSDRIAIGDVAGTPPELAETSYPPELLLALAQTQVWRLSEGRIAVATPLRGADGVSGRVVYGEARLPPTRLDGAWWTLAASLAAAGALLGWYLVRRIYLPIESLAARADALLAGRDPGAARQATAETAAASSSLIKLMERYRSTSDQQAPPPAQR